MHQTMTIARLCRSIALASVLAATALVSELPAAGSALADEDHGAVYSMTNATSANGGNGTGAGLGSRHSIAVSGDGREPVVVNAAVSAFRARRQGLELIGTPQPSGGTRPVNVTIADDVVYVLNAGSNSIAGFRLDDDRGFTPIAGSIRPLGAGTSVACRSSSTNAAAC